MDEIEMRINKALGLLRDAKRELEMGMYGRCCSTSYYAMFHAAKAMILWLGKESKTHRGTIYLIWENRKNLGLDEEDCLKLSKAFDLREESDYGIFREITEEVAKEVVKDAETFITKAENIIRKTS